MKVKFHYGDGVLNLPSQVLDILPRADGDALRVLLLLAGAGTLSVEKIAAEAGLDAAVVETAIAFWRGAGLIEIDTPKSAPKSTSKSAAKKPSAATVLPSSPDAPEDGHEEKKPTQATTLPAYTTEELTALLERRRELVSLIDECSAVFGKIFNAHEVSKLLGLVDYLSLDGEYLLLLLAHCVKMGKKSLRYVENVAISLYDSGITSVPELQECLKHREEQQAAEGQIRTMFGIHGRALTTKEKKLIDAWMFTLRFPMDVIQYAYEKTIDAIAKPSLPYANSILERWAKEDLHTLEQIKAADEAAKAAASSAPSSPGSSFDTDDFFDAALQRSFGDYDSAGSDAPQDH